MHNSNRLQQAWLKFSLAVDSALVEAVSDFLVGVTGAEVEIVVDDKRPLITVNAFWEKQGEDDTQCETLLQQLSGHVSELADIFQVPVPDIVHSVIADQDWANTWKEHFKPFAVVPGLVIKPTWEHYPVDADELVIEMDPGMAFGTGHHATTTMSLELMKDVLQAREHAIVLDVGTGTGILGMAAVRFGAERVIGIDNDPEAVDAACDNVRRNSMGEKMSVSLTRLAELHGSFSLVIANIIHDILIDLADDLVRLMAIGGKLILSGILTGAQCENIREHFTRKGLRLERHLQKKEWSALLFAR